jgi:adenosylcobinamide-phosphate synthase
MEKYWLLILPLIVGYLLDLLLGDPESLPHPVRLFGNLIAKGEQFLNRQPFSFLKGMLLTIVLTSLTFLFFYKMLGYLLLVHPLLYLLTTIIFVFYGLANKGLIVEGQKVFAALHSGIEAGRRQLSRIVGRDTSTLNEQQIRVAAFETMSENLSDGVIAPLFYYALAGVPGMMAYKMVNTLDSMIGYRSERYEQFGKFAARLDDVANFIPARLTAILMALISGSKRSFQFIMQYGNKHKSPNSGYPEAALAGILNTRFGGPNIYQGVLVDKPFIGCDDRAIEADEIKRVSSVNHRTCFLMIILSIAFILLLN